MESFNRESVADALREHGSIAGAARALDKDRRRLSEYVAADPELTALRWGPSAAGGSPTLAVKGDTAELDIPSTDLGDMASYVRSRGLDPDEWYVTALKVWQTYHGEDRYTAYLRRTAAMKIISPATHVPEVIRPVPVKKAEGTPDLIIVEGDHQAPYHDPGLDACATAFWQEMQPDEAVFLGDTADFPTISRHPDHPAAAATPQECVDAAYSLLRRRVNAAPNAKVWKLKGNHDWRVEGESLARSERMYGLHPAGEDVASYSLRRLLKLDELGITLVEDIRGWEHAEVVLVPGGNGLVVRHGLVTGAGTAGKTMAKLGRSVIVGHGHQKESAWRLVYPKKRLQWGFVAGTMSRNDGVFPHFTVNPNWHLGFVTVQRWGDGTFIIEHAVYQNGCLYWRDKRWNSADYLGA
jgi:hypothetical protein